MQVAVRLLTAALATALSAILAASEPPALPAGHSLHGEAFNEGPRQKARLLGGTGKVSFPVTVNDSSAQAFINQGVGQLHGFWYFEAERSFRQAAMIAPDCAMAYWGMALANVNNEKRAKGFIAEAAKRKDRASEREALYIDAFDAYLKAGPDKKKERGPAYVKALEKILYKFPDDIEARAFLAVQIWKNREDGAAIQSHLAVDALLDPIFKAEPMHPAHHYRIHLWDGERAEKALASAALCGQAAPEIAHMWHMPGHTYSNLKRFADAAWQQEASARVDHAHMMEDGVLPDQIHNFAHNNEWLIRNLSHIGRAHDAVDLARNMIELPRHPAYNTLAKGSAHHGRQRLFEVLQRYELWDELIAACQTPYLEPTDNDAEQVKRARALAVAYFRKGDVEKGKAELAALEERLEKEKKLDTASAKPGEKPKAEEKTESPPNGEPKPDAEPTPKEPAKDEKAAEKSKTESRKGLVKNLEKAVAELKGFLAAAKGEHKDAAAALQKADAADKNYLARLQLLAGDKEQAEKTARKFAGDHKNEVQPLAGLVDILWQCGKKEEAAKSFKELRELSGSLDLDAPPFARLAPMAKELGFPADWRAHKAKAKDFGKRPNLDSLGPFRWSPSPAPEWTLKDASGTKYTLKQFHGRPVIAIFFLGFECKHCAEQLRKFAEMAGDFSAAGIQLIAISTEDAPPPKSKDGAPPFPLACNAKLDVFKSYRAFDDFENRPLHGTFLIDAAGLVRWHDISHEPFSDAKFVLQESKRLLSWTR